MECVVTRVMEADLIVILILVAMVEILYALNRRRKVDISKEPKEYKHIGSHILMLIGFIGAALSFMITSSLAFISVWGVYSIWHMHTENKDLSSGNYHK